MITTEWTIYPPGTAYVCIAELIPEPEGGYSIICLNLPGCASQGETIPEALEMIKDAFVGCMLAYRDAGEEPPWDNSHWYDRGRCFVVEMPNGNKRHA